MAAVPPPPTGDSGPAGPPSPNAAFLLMALGRRTREQVDARLRGLGLTYRHFSALGHLAGRPELSYSELARRAGVTAQSMQATVGHLEQVGAVERITLPGRGRRSQLRVTDHGLGLLRAGAAALDDVEQRLLAALGADQRRELTAALSAVFRASLDPHPDR